MCRSPAGRQIAEQQPVYARGAAIAAITTANKCDSRQACHKALLLAAPAQHQGCSRYVLTFLLKAHSFSQSCSVVALLAPCPRMKSFSACSWRPRRKMPCRQSVHQTSTDYRHRLTIINVAEKRWSTAFPLSFSPVVCSRLEDMMGSIESVQAWLTGCLVPLEGQKRRAEGELGRSGIPGADPCPHGRPHITCPRV